MARARAHDVKGNPLTIGDKVNVPCVINSINLETGAITVRTALNPEPVTAHEAQLVLDGKQVKKSEAKG
jgi:hypothetical protein